MTSIEIKERWEKAKATVEKKAATIERHKAQMLKKADILKKAEWLDITDPSAHKWNEEERKRYKEETGRDLYWDFCDYESKMRDIKDATKKLADATETMLNWEDRYKKALERELVLAKEVPPAFHEARKALVDSWTEYDIKFRDKMNEYIDTHEYDDYKKRYPYSVREQYRKTDEQFKKINEREADIWLLDLYNRVKKITGSVTDASHVRWGGKCLDGYVVGENGKANVTTIEAGGYNIQKWHLRTLVTECK